MDQQLNAQFKQLQKRNKKDPVLNRIWMHNICNSRAGLYWLSYQANWQLVTHWVWVMQALVNKVTSLVSYSISEAWHSGDRVGHLIKWWQSPVIILLVCILSKKLFDSECHASFTIFKDYICVHNCVLKLSQSHSTSSSRHMKIEVVKRKQSLFKHWIKHVLWTSNISNLNLKISILEMPYESNAVSLFCSSLNMYSMWCL